MSKRPQNTIYWGAGLAVYLLVVAVVIAQILDADHEHFSSERFLPDPVHRQGFHSLISELDDAAEYAGVLLPMGPDDGRLPGLPALWDELLRVPDVAADEIDAAGFDGIQAVSNISEFSKGVVSELFIAGEPKSVFPFGGLLLLLDHDGKIHLVDCKHPKFPQLLEPFPYSSVEKVLVRGTVAYLLMKNSEASATELVIVDLADPAKPKELARHSLKGKIINFFLLGDQLIAYQNSGGHKGRQFFRLFDVTEKFDLLFAGQARAPVFGRSVVTYANYLLSPDLRDGINIYDLSDPLDPSLVSSLSLSAIVRSLARLGDQLFAHDERGKIYVVDLQDIKTPVLSSVINNANHFTYFINRGGYSYYFTSNGYLRVFDTPFEELARFGEAKRQRGFSGHFLPTQEGDGFAYLGEEKETLAKELVNTFSWDEVETVVDALFWKDLLVILDKAGNVSFFEKSGLSELRLVDRLELSQPHQWLTADSEHLYAGGTAVDVIAKSAERSFVKERRLPLDSLESFDGLVVQNALLVAAGKSGLFSVALQDLAQPKPLSLTGIPRHLQSQIDARQLVSSGVGRVMVAGGEAGLIALRFDDGVGRVEGVLGYSQPALALGCTDEFCLLSDGTVVNVVDVSVEGSLQKVGEIAFAGVKKLVVAKEKLWAGYAPASGWTLLPSPRFISFNKSSETTILAELGGDEIRRYRLNLFDDNGLVNLPGVLSLASVSGPKESGENRAED